MLIVLGSFCFALGRDCCERCGCKLQCKVVCEWKTYKVLRYKVEHTECPPPCCVCCDDHCIIGCPKPIKILSLKPHYEERKKLVGQHTVQTCPQCDHQDSATLPNKSSSAMTATSTSTTTDR